jgi:SRSO17 transposase
MQELYANHAYFRHKIKDCKGYFIIDDTMTHHSKFCQWLHGVFVLFDHAIGTNLKARCIVVLYYSDGGSAKFPLAFRLYYQESSKMPWTRRKKLVHKTKNELAIEMLEWALAKGYPPCTVLADSWFGVAPFIKGLKRLKLSYVIEIKNSLKVRVTCSNPKLTPTGKLAKKQYELKSLSDFFNLITDMITSGFAADEKLDKEAKVLYHTKVANVRLNAIPGKHRIVQSLDPSKDTIKYLLTNELTWESSKIISVYSYRWVIEEFFRNAKQLLDMEGVTVRSEQGITTALCLVFYIDFLLHLENCKSTAENTQMESKTIPSIVRRLQHENQVKFINKVQEDSGFVKKWITTISSSIDRERKQNKPLVDLSFQEAEEQLKNAV